jgi:hypothetical protein
MAYVDVCPPAHTCPRTRFRLTYVLRNPTSALALSDLTDHNGETIHFDFISGWDEESLLKSMR